MNNYQTQKPRRGVESTRALLSFAVLLLSMAPAMAQTPTQERDAILLGADRGTNDFDTRSAAVSGDTAIIGTLGHTHDFVNEGAVYVFVKDGAGAWPQQAELRASDGKDSLFLGFLAAIDGDTIVAGTGRDGAYVFVRSGTTWTQQAKLVSSDFELSDRFGQAVAISGNTIVVAAQADDNENGVNAGAAYVFVRNGTTWTQQAKLVANNGLPDDFFSGGSGGTVAIDGDTVVVSAFGADRPYGCTVPTVCDREGTVYVFVRNDTTWTQEAELIGTGDFNDLHWGVTISGDTLAFGQPGDDDFGTSSGSVSVFTRTGTTWTFQQRLFASDAAFSASFGQSVSLDCDTLAVSARIRPPGGGKTYLFTRDGTGTWTEQLRLIIPEDPRPNIYQVGLSGAHAVASERNSFGSRVYTHNFNTCSASGGDSDGDGVNDDLDNCPNDANELQEDLDEDGVGDVCDDDADGDGDPAGSDCADLDPTRYTGAIEICTDMVDNNCNGQVDEQLAGSDCDGDGIPNEDDNCPLDDNGLQEDLDDDGFGDVCDDDIDGDGIPNEDDNCPSNANLGQEDLDGDGSGDVCDADADGDGLDDTDGDLCLGSTANDPAAGVPSRGLGKNRWANMDSNIQFDTRGNNPTGRSFTILDTAGCNCAQIIELCGYGNGHTQFGCSNSVMDWWTGLHDRLGEPAYQCKDD